MNELERFQDMILCAQQCTRGFCTTDNCDRCQAQGYPTRNCGSCARKRRAGEAPTSKAVCDAAPTLADALAQSCGLSALQRAALLVGASPLAVLWHSSPCVGAAWVPAQVLARVAWLLDVEEREVLAALDVAVRRYQSHQGRPEGHR